MKLDKKEWTMLVVGAVALFLVYWLFFRKKKSESGYDDKVLIMGDSSYDPAFPEISASESGFKRVGSAVGVSPSHQQQVGGCHTAGGWSECYWCNSWDSKGNCNGWTKKCCKGRMVRNPETFGFGQENSFRTAAARRFSGASSTGSAVISSRKRCEKCKSGCVPPCSGSCVEYVDCPTITGGGGTLTPLPM